MPRLFALIIACTLLLATLVARADGVAQDDRYVVYYSTVNSSLIPASVADKLQLVRSRERGFITIAVQRKRDNGPAQPVTTMISGTTRRGNGNELPLEFSLSQEDGYISYVAPFLIPDGDPLLFDIDVKPSAEHSGFHLKFSNTLFVDR